MNLFWRFFVWKTFGISSIKIRAIVFSDYEKTIREGVYVWEREKDWVREERVKKWGKKRETDTEKIDSYLNYQQLKRGLVLFVGTNLRPQIFVFTSQVKASLNGPSLKAVEKSKLNTFYKLKEEKTSWVVHGSRKIVSYKLEWNHKEKKEIGVRGYEGDKDKLTLRYYNDNNLANCV